MKCIIVCLMFVGAVLAIKETVKTKRAYDYVGYDYEPYFDYRLPLAPISDNEASPPTYSHPQTVPAPIYSPQSVASSQYYSHAPTVTAQIYSHNPIVSSQYYSHTPLASQYYSHAPPVSTKIFAPTPVVSSQYYSHAAIALPASHHQQILSEFHRR